MEEWKEYSLGDIVNLVIDYRGKTPLKLGGSWSQNGYRALSAKNIKTGAIVNEDSIRFVDEELYRRWMKDEVQRGDIFVTSEAPFGQIYYWNSDEKIVLSQRLFCLRLSEEVCSKFVYYYMITNTFQAELDGRATGTTVIGLRQPELLKCKINLPPLAEQQRIASILSSLDEKIEVNRRINDNFYLAFIEVMLIWLLTSLRNDNLEQQAQALFKSWFVDFEPFRDQPFVESELGMIPEGWRVGTLNELGDVVGGSTPSKAKPEYYTNNGIAWLTPKDLSISQRKFTSKGEIDITQEGYESCSTKLMPKGSVLFSSRAPIGYITIAKNDICTNQGFKSVIPKFAGTAFLYCFLKESTQEIENKATGSTFKEASGALMKSLPAIIPEKAVLDDFENLLSPLFCQQEVVEEENTLLSSLRDSLLPRLMSGELNVSEINV